MLAAEDLREKRRYERYTSRVSINYSVFGTKPGYEYASIAINYGKGGICFESASPINPGTTLFIRSDKNPIFDLDGKKCEHLRTATLAEVRWCQKLSDKLRTFHRIGVTYYHPYCI